MRLLKTIRIYIFCALALLLIQGYSFAAEAVLPESLLPEGFVMAEEFKPGFGAPIGSIQLVQGKVVITHDKSPEGYLVRNDLPIYKNDNIITMDKGRVKFELNDGSAVTLASGAAIQMSQSVYEEQKKSRFSFLKLNFGKARFLVTKMAGFSRSDFKVRTPTAVVGVRGSDFIINATNETTQVTALEKTQIEVVSLATPEKAPTLLEDFQQTIVAVGFAPTDVEDLSADQAEQMTREFSVNSSVEGTEDDIETGREPVAKQPVFVPLPEEPPSPESDLLLIDPPEPELSDIPPGPAPEPPELPIEIEDDHESDEHEYHYE